MQAIERVRQALLQAGQPDTITLFSEGTHTAADAAASVGCNIAQIAKSIVFRTGDTPVLVIVSGNNRVDRAKVAALIGSKIDRADPAWVAEVTGFAVGGVAPTGHLTPPITLVDICLADLGPIWAAAGSPQHVFQTTAAALLALTGGRLADIRAS